jgi:hypothetical protein
MRKLNQTYVKFTRTNGDTYYVSLFSVLNNPDAYQDEIDDLVYEWADSPQGWMYLPIT